MLAKRNPLGEEHANGTMCDRRNLVKEVYDGSSVLVNTTSHDVWEDGEECVLGMLKRGPGFGSLCCHSRQPISSMSIINIGKFHID